MSTVLELLGPPHNLSCSMNLLSVVIVMAINVSKSSGKSVAISDFCRQTMQKGVKQCGQILPTVPC